MVAVFNQWNHRKEPLLAFLALAIPLPVFAQQEPIFRSAVSVVRVDVEVADATGRVPTGLGKADFRLFDDDREQSPTGIGFERESLDLILLFDTSAGMRGKLLTLMRAIELGFHELRAGDRVCVMAFHRSVTEIAPFNADLDTVNQTVALRIPQLRFEGDARELNALDAAALRFRAEPANGRLRAVLVVTDKNPPRDASEKQVIRDLWASNAVASELILGKTAQSNAVVDGTGGAAIASGSDPGAAFQESLRRIRSRYTLYYAMPAGTPGAERTIRVEVGIPAARVRARSGYIVPTAP